MEKIHPYQPEGPYGFGYDSNGDAVSIAFANNSWLQLLGYDAQNRLTSVQTQNNCTNQRVCSLVDGVAIAYNARGCGRATP